MAPRLSNNLAIALGELGNLDGAESEARKALETSPGFVDAMLTLAAALDRQGRVAEELRILEQALQRSENRPDIAVRTALAASSAGDCDRALELLEPILSRNRDAGIPADIHLAAARCLEARAKVTEALRHYNEAARLAHEGPVREEASQGVRRLSLGLGNTNSTRK
jgi:tetratricopeptide (TPR) repeat protein